ncbi:MAG: ATP-grasp domain-containing protein [Desulfobacteraceae bacterium]|nr:MAG: ATP-grasp domain-containing protein [Desulfobacteraceae bacterium]
MPKRDKVLVVGTTSDYIDWIQNTCPGRVLFMTDQEVRINAKEDSPVPEDELILPLTDLVNTMSKKPAIVLSHVFSELKHHLELWNQSLSGIICFDCEFLELTARIASVKGLEYPSVQAIRNCRDKFVSKKIWQENGVLCPKTLPVNSAEDAVRFLSESENGIVLKPFYGSGSELVFRCRTPEECNHAFNTIKDGLRKRCSKPLFLKSSSEEHLMMAEQFIPGPEYSCDCIIDEDRVRMIRLTRKIKSSNQPFGTISGYMLPAILPANIGHDSLKEAIRKGAKALGVSRGLCMVDFILGVHYPFLIEMTPRPGGDCLPFLLKEAGNLDILSLALDFAENKPIDLNGSTPANLHVGLRIHASKSGVFKGYDTSLLADENRLKQIHIIRQPGHEILLPPDDYDSWLIGHMIIEPNSSSYPETQCFTIGKRLQMEIE